MDTNKQSDTQEKPDKGKGADESKLPDGMGYGKVKSLEPPRLEVRVSLIENIDEGKIYPFIATFKPEIEKEYFIKETQKQGIVALVGTGRGTVISVPPPSYQGVIYVTDASPEHKKGDYLWYIADFTPLAQNNYRFFELQRNNIELVEIGIP